MKKIFIIPFFLLFTLFARANNEPEHFLIVSCKEDPCQLGTETCFINEVGDTVIPYGVYTAISNERITTIGMVMKITPTGFKCVALNNVGKELYEVYWFDNGPDYIKNGLYRIKVDGKIGYANALGEIVIPAQFECADPFDNGKARVSKECQLEKSGEHTAQHSDEWFYIDTSGNRIE